MGVSWLLRVCVRIVVMGALVATLLVPVAAQPAAAADNPTVTENQLPGTTAWRLNKRADDVQKQIKGFASRTSVDKGETIDFHVSVSNPQNFSIKIFRIGWYDGDGGRLLTTLGPFAGITQPAPVVAAGTGMVTAPWSSSASFVIPSSWVSGAFLAVIVRADGYDNYIPFVVRDDARPADLLTQLGVTTYQAYNNFPDDNPSGGPPLTGKSLYEYNSSGLTRATKVSFDRPYARDGSGLFFSWDFATIQFLEREGYDVVYSTSVDTHADGAELLNHKAFLSLGHDEYWSEEMYNAAEAARDHPAGDTDLAFLGANNVYWRISFESSPTTGANRVVACERQASLLWRNQGRPESELVGVQYVSPPNNQPPYQPLIVQNASHFVWAGAGVTNGTAIPQLAGYEIDGFNSSAPPHRGPNPPDRLPVPNP